MHRTNRCGSIIGAAFTLSLWLEASCSAIVIDSFDTPGGLTYNDFGSAEAFDAAPEAIGGERDFHVQQFVISGTATTAMAVSGGALQFLHARTATTVAISGSIIWDGPDANSDFDIDGLGGLDFTEGGAHDRLQIRILNSSQSQEMNLQVFSGFADEFTSWVFTIPATTTPLDIYLPYSSGENIGGGADMTSVGLVYFGNTTDPPGDIDLRIDFIQTVPEPSTFALAAIAGGLLLAMRRRFARR